MKIAKFYFLEEILAQVTHFSQNLRPRVNLDFSKWNRKLLNGLEDALKVF